jgi:iron-sulfur cluster repair protein YtfE (RIC family)
MNNSSNWLVHDHQKYDAILDECEMAADAGEWKNAKSLFQNFITELKLHMQMEDQVLYPLFIEENGDPNCVIKHLSEEHDYLVRLVQDLSYIIKANDFDHFLDSLEPLHKAMNEHNEHEESVFLSMANQSILMRRDEVMQRLAAVENKKGSRNRIFDLLRDCVDLFLN